MSARARVRVGGVVVLLGSVLVIGGLTSGPAPEPAAAQEVPVSTRTAVCPDVLQDGDRGSTAVTAAGAATRVAGPPAGPPAPLPEGPVVRDLGARVRGPYVVAAEGSEAGALVVEQATRATAGGRRGLAALACPSPATSGWFVGGSTVVGARSELMLVNVEEQPAVVDVRVWTADGPADPRPGRDLSVPARGRLVVPLDRLAPDRDLLALHVRTSRGRVASAVRVSRSDGRTPRGVDWVPAARPPAAEHVVPGLPAGPGRRTLLLTNPGEQDAAVAVELTTDDGQYVPEGLEAVPVPAGTSVDVDLKELLEETPAAVRVRSDGPPVLAGGLVIDDQRRPTRDFAYTASTPALDTPALMADVRLTAATEVTLLLSALTEDAVVELVPVAAPGDLPEPQRVEVPAATTVAVPLSRFLPSGSTGSLAIEVRPVRGRVHAARYSRERGSRGPLTSVLPLSPGPSVVRRPPVVADLGAGR